MNNSPQRELKEALKRALVGQLNAQLLTITTSAKRAQDTALGDTKSSAGDKFETTRAMMHRELERLGHQERAIEKDLATLSQITFLDTRNEAGLGSVVITSLGCFFVAVSGNDITVDQATLQESCCDTSELARCECDGEITPISTQSPIGIALIGAESKSTVAFRGSSFVVVLVI